MIYRYVCVVFLPNPPTAIIEFPKQVTSWISNFSETLVKQDIYYCNSNEFLTHLFCNKLWQRLDTGRNR